MYERPLRCSEEKRGDHTGCRPQTPRLTLRLFIDAFLLALDNLNAAEFQRVQDALNNELG